MGFSGRTERAQTSPLGVALIVGIVIAGTVSVVVFGSAALTSTEHSAELGQAEHTMSQFDSLAAQVALGDSTVQSLQVGGATGGGYQAKPDAGRIVIVHANYSGSGTDHEIYNETMGAIVYSNGDDEIAYQGGGVWKNGGSGSARMVSPPEFHYRQATLTFPIIRVNPSGASGAVSGAQTISVRRTAEVNEVFPNADNSYPSGRPYQNPQANGTVRVKVQSEYYEAWASYFRARTTGEVDVYDSNQTVTVELISLGTGQGPFSMPPEGSPIEVRGLKPQGHALDSFEIELRPDESDSANFNNLQWSLYADEGDREFEIHLKKGSSGDCGSQTVDVSMYYTEDGGDTYQGWKKEDALTVQCDADGNAVLMIDLAQITAEATYQELQKDDMEATKPQQGTLISSTTIDEHSGVTWEPSTYDQGDGDSEEVGRLYSHYLAMLGPDIDLEVVDKGSNTVEESASSGSIGYEGTGQFVTFLHVSENEVEVEFE